MKYSFMSFSCPELSIDQVLNTAKLYNYDGIEPRIDAGHKHGIETSSPKQILKEARHKAEEIGIKICCIGTSCIFSSPLTVNENIEHCKHIIELAREVNSPAIRVFGGAIPKGISREKSFDLIVESLSELSNLAIQNGVTICMETHDSWCNPEIVADIIRKVNHQAIAVNWDIMHPVLTAECTIEKAFEVLKPWIRHVHVHDGLRTDEGLEFKPIGSGKVDHKAAIKLLKAFEYNGYISGEWINWEPYDIHLPRELSVMKSFE